MFAAQLRSNLAGFMPPFGGPSFRWVSSENSGGCFQFYGGGDAADALDGSLVVVSPESFRCWVLCLLDDFKDVLVASLDRVDHFVC